MGRAAKKSSKTPDEGVGAADSPAAALRAELFDAARKASKSAEGEEALHHFIAVFILDANLSAVRNSNPQSTLQESGRTATHDEEVLSQIQKITKKAFGDERTKLWIAFADVHQEMVELLTPLTKPLELGPCLQIFRNAVNR